MNDFWHCRNVRWFNDKYCDKDMTRGIFLWAFDTKVSLIYVYCFEDWCDLSNIKEALIIEMYVEEW